MSTELKTEWTVDGIRELLATSDTAVWRGISAIRSLQTIDEQRAGITVASNGVGFNAIDAEILSSFADQIDRWDKEKYDKPLSPKQLHLGRKKMMKYARQLLGIAKSQR